MYCFSKLWWNCTSGSSTNWVFLFCISRKVLLSCYAILVIFQGWKQARGSVETNNGIFKGSLYRRRNTLLGRRWAFEYMNMYETKTNHYLVVNYNVFLLLFFFCFFFFFFVLKTLQLQKGNHSFHLCHGKTILSLMYAFSKYSPLSSSVLCFYLSCRLYLSMLLSSQRLFILFNLLSHKLFSWSLRKTCFAFMKTV